MRNYVADKLEVGTRYWFVNNRLITPPYDVPSSTAVQSVAPNTHCVRNPLMSPRTRLTGLGAFFETPHRDVIHAARLCV